VSKTWGVLGILEKNLRAVRRIAMTAFSTASG
jgi:hypothetical protein